MKRSTATLHATAILLGLLGAGPAKADTTQARCDIHAKGSDRAAAVIPCSFSQRQGHVAIDRSDGVRHELSPAGSKAGSYLDEKGRPAYRKSGLGKRGLIFQLAEQSVYVYWDTAGLPGTATQAGSAGGAAPVPKAAAPLVPLDRTLTLLGVSFRVISRNDSSLNTLEIVPGGLEIDNRKISRQIDGVVTGVEVADLNADGSPEIYVYVTSAGSGSYGSVVAYSANKRKSLSEAYLPPIAENPKALQGYMGHDEFAVVEGRLIQRFPLYRSTDSNAKPTGGMRQIQYELVPGEAGWILKPDRMVDY